MSIRNTEEDAIYCGRNHGATTSITYLDPRSTLPTATISASTMWIISMSSHAKCLLLVVMVVALYGSTARADSKTYVSNEASLTIVATTSYSFGHSEFVDRYIAPGTYGKCVHEPSFSWDNGCCRCLLWIVFSCEFWTPCHALDY